MHEPTVLCVERTLRKPAVILGAAAVLGVGLLAVLWLALPLYKPVLADPFWFPIVVMAVMLLLILNGTAACILAERKIASWTQDRFGPNRVGWWGLLQPVADGLKFLLKEDITPRNVDRPLFLLAPCLALVMSLVGFAIVPWAGDVHWPWMPAGQTVRTQVASIDVGLLYILAVGSLGVYGVVLAGYASNNKYSFLGGMRGAAQMISYEIPLALSLVGVVVLAGSLSLTDIVKAQVGLWFIVKQPLGFLIFVVALSAETNRTPFDLLECENELVAGYQTEYSSMKFGLFYMAEYAHLLLASFLVTLLFLGGWNGPLLPALVWFGIKLFAVFFVFIWVRATFPRIRYDQLMMFSWKVLTPLAFLNLLITAAFVVLQT